MLKNFLTILLVIYIGCCRAFSALATMEGVIKLKTGNLISLSKQELVVSWTMHLSSSNMNTAFNWKKYSYSENNSTCNANKDADQAAAISGQEQEDISAKITQGYKEA